MNHKEAIRANQKLNRLFWLIRRCVTTTELEMRKKKAEEERAQENNKHRNNFKRKKLNYASR